MDSQLGALLQACKNEPMNYEPRLILADWLDDHGEAERALLVRCQNDHSVPDHDRQERRLLRRHRMAWVGPLTGLPGKWTIRGGLLLWRVPASRLDAKDLALVEQSSEAPWVEGIQLTGCKPKHFQKLRGLTHWPFTALDLEGSWLSDAGAVELAALPYLGRIVYLELSGNGVGPTGAAALAASPHLVRLSYLGLGSNNIGDAGAAALAGSPHLARLSWLHLYRNNIGAEGMAALAVSPHLARLKRLELSTNSIGEAGAAALAATSRLTSLTHLNLSWNSLGDAGAAALAASPRLASLTDLDLSVNSIGDEGAMALAASPHLRRLTSLGLRVSIIGEAAVAALQQRWGDAAADGIFRVVSDPPAH